jgi:hypothetical protein
MGFAGRVVKKHKKALKGAFKVHKKAFKIGKKVHKYANPLTGPSNALGKLIGGKAGRVIGRGGAAAATGGMSEAVRMFKKLIKKKNTNVGKAGKEKRRDRIDKREGSPSDKVVERRANVDAKDNKRFGENKAARDRINKKIERMNKNKGTNYKTYAEAASTAPAATGRGTSSGRRGQGGGAASTPNAAAVARNKARADARRARRNS